MIFVKSALKWKQQLLICYATKTYQFKAKDLEIKPYILCLGNISKDFAIGNMKKKQD